MLMCNKGACHNVYNLNTRLHLTLWHVNEKLGIMWMGIAIAKLMMSGYHLTLIGGKLRAYHLLPVTSQIYR